MWDQLSIDEQMAYANLMGTGDLAAAGQMYNAEVAASQKNAGAPVAAAPVVAAAPPEPAITPGVGGPGVLGTAALPVPPMPQGQGVLGTVAPLQAPPIATDPASTGGAPTTDATSQAPTGSVSAVPYGGPQGSQGSYTGGGSGGSSLSTGRNTIPAGQQSEWSAALHSSGALQDPRANPIPFGSHPAGVFDSYMGVAQGAQGSSPPAVGGYGSPPTATPGPQMNSPAVPSSPPPVMGSMGGSAPAGPPVLPPPPPMDPAQQQLMAGQMNELMRKRYGGF
jgi:hypothetical protein